METYRNTYRHTYRKLSKGKNEISKKVGKKRETDFFKKSERKSESGERDDKNFRWGWRSEIILFSLGNRFLNVVVSSTLKYCSYYIDK